jgi:protease-4
MGNLAASGGYFVAMGANKILAQPGTITGSIGVLGGKMVTTELWEKLGISWDEVHTSKNSTFWSGTHDYTPEQWAVFQSWLDRIYEDFTEKVGQGRNMSIDKVKAVAKGRVWSGDDARRVGLVDQLGGFREAIELAREASGISETEKFSLVVYPKKKTLLDLLTDKFLAVKENSSNPHTLVSALKSFQPYFNVLAKLGLTHTGVLSLPPEYIYCQ